MNEGEIRSVGCINEMQWHSQPLTALFLCVVSQGFSTTHFFLKWGATADATNLIVFSPPDKMDLSKSFWFNMQ